LFAIVFSFTLATKSILCVGIHKNDIRFKAAWMPPFLNFTIFMSHNVPVVYDVFAVAIKERGAFQQPQKCGGEKPHKGRKPDCGFS
jgi:hypothetical protein